MSVQSITNDVIRQQLTKDAIPETPVQDGMRCILAELVLVEKHCQHLGCLVEELSLYKEKLRRSIQSTTEKRSRPQRLKRMGWMIERKPSIYGRRHKDSLIPPTVGEGVHLLVGDPCRGPPCTMSANCNMDGAPSTLLLQTSHPRSTRGTPGPPPALDR